MNAMQLPILFPLIAALGSTNRGSSNGEGREEGGEKDSGAGGREARYMTIIQPEGWITYRNLSRYSAETYVEHFNELWRDKGLYAIMVPETGEQIGSDAR